MKFLLGLSFVLLLTSCSSQKTVVEETQPETQEIPVEQEATIQNNVEVVQDIKVETEVKISVQNDTPVSTTVLDDTQATNDSIEAVNTKDITKNNVFDHSTFDALLKKYVSDAGFVNYVGFKSDRSKLRAYIALLGENLPSDSWTDSDKIAYWINAYNAMTIDLILQNYPLQSIKDIKDPWGQRLWKLGAKWYNLNEIEHDILRKMGDPRIHFGIVCASYSCPKLQNEAFFSATLDKQLTSATQSFLADRTRNNIEENRIEISKIFQWFAKDFKQDGSLIDFLNKYSEVKISENAKKSFLDYNWSLNKQ